MKKNREVICAFAAWVLSACFFMSCFMIPGLAEKINSLGNSNMLVYGMSLILFCLLFVVGMGIAHRHEVAGKTFPENVKARKTAFWLMLFIQIPFWLLCISGETEQLGSVAAKYGWHTQPAVIAAFLFLAELAIFFWACQNVCFPEKDGEWIIRLVYAALVLLVFYSMYTPNIFGRGELSDAYHGHAYFNSVYNIYQGMPYTHNVTSIYGHYGLFFKIPMELVHGDFKAFVAMVAGIGAFAHICAFLILELLVKSRVLRVLGALAVTFPVLGMRGGFYWQVWPHRVIFPMLLFLYGAWILKKELCSLFFGKGAADAVTGVLLHGKAAAVHGERVSRRFAPSLQCYRKLVAVNGIGAILLHVRILHGAFAFSVERPCDHAVISEISRPCSGQRILAATGGKRQKRNRNQE